MMTAPMIEWTLELLDWMRAQLFETWPSVKMRGSAPELTEEGYRIRFRDQGRQFWLCFSPDAIQQISVEDVRCFLDSQDWIPLLQNTGTLAVDVASEDGPRPILNLFPTMEVKTGTC